MEEQMHSSESTNPETGQPWMFGNHTGSGQLPWQWATERLTRARNYWIVTTRPTGQPHSRPVWGIWLDNAFYFSTGSLAAQNLTIQPAITVHLESGNEVVILEGNAQVVNDISLLEQIVSLYNQKYNWNLDIQHLDGPFYTVHPQIAFGWHFEESGVSPEVSALGNATRWRFPHTPTNTNT